MPRIANRNIGIQTAMATTMPATGPAKRNTARLTASTRKVYRVAPGFRRVGIEPTGNPVLSSRRDRSCVGQWSPNPNLARHPC